MAKHSKSEQNARFWAWINGGLVKVTLTPGQTVSRCISYPTDEGYHGEAETWELWDGEVTCQIDTWGRDCDGRLETSCETVCGVENLAENLAYHDDGEPVPTHNGRPIRVPAWWRKRSGQRDYSAEAAGY